MSLTVVVPSKERPANAERLLNAFAETRALPGTRLVFALDHDEPEPSARAYAEMIPSRWSWASVTRVHAVPQRMCPVLNHVAVRVSTDASVRYVGFMGDDCIPRTEAWDEKLTSVLRGMPGVAYGNDLAQGERLPTSVIVSAALIRVLGFMCPPGLDHLYADNFWKELGTRTCLVYDPSVIIEHMHPDVGKAKKDASYQKNNNYLQYAKDEAAYQVFLRSGWNSCLERLRQAGLVPAISEG